MTAGLCLVGNIKTARTHLQAVKVAVLRRHPHRRGTVPGRTEGSKRGWKEGSKGRRLLRKERRMSRKERRMSRKEQRTEGRTEGTKEGRKEGRKRKEVKNKGTKEGPMDGRKMQEGGTNGRTDGRTKGTVHVRAVHVRAQIVQRKDDVIVA
jgi:hypothetical protein